MKHTFGCDRRNCFANLNGGCDILTGETRKQPCPFYKTEEQLNKERRYGEAVLRRRSGYGQ